MYVIKFFSYVWEMISNRYDDKSPSKEKERPH